MGSLYGGASYLARYEQFPYKFWGYPKFARNQLENAPGKHVATGNEQGAHPVSERPLYPRRLCFVDTSGKDSGGIHLYDVELWLEQHNMIEHDMRFIVVAYTSTQFTDTDEDTEALHAIAREAAIQNKCPAYWVGSACMSEDPNELEQDVFRISDVIRAAYAVVIAIKPQPGNQTASVDGLLKDWGSRMWTLPEALLAPKDKPIQIYNARGGRPEFVKGLPKKDLATLVWNDTSKLRIHSVPVDAVTAIALSSLEHANTTRRPHTAARRPLRGKPYSQSSRAGHLSSQVLEPAADFKISRWRPRLRLDGFVASPPSDRSYGHGIPSFRPIVYGQRQ